MEADRESERKGRRERAGGRQQAVDFNSIPAKAERG